MYLREVTYLSVVVRILTALILGGILGIEREIKNRPAGMRTYMLVCVGSCMIMLTNQYIYQILQVGDPTRMSAQIVSGIGFLGAGTIIVTKRNQIKGLTTAAGLWTTAAVGLAVGIGFYEVAVFGGIVIFIILTLLQYIDASMHRKTKRIDFYVELSATIYLSEFVEKLKSCDLNINSIKIDAENNYSGGVRSFIISARVSQRIERIILADKIRSLPGVMYLEEI